RVRHLDNHPKSGGATMFTFLFAVNSRVTGAMKSISSAVLLTCLLALTALGQATTGSLSGTINDPGGAVVAGATVTVVNTATGAERSAITSSEGTFDFQTLQPGTYRISVEAKGFRKAVARDLV